MYKITIDELKEIIAKLETPYKRFENKIFLNAITGTNGKTSSVFFFKQIMNSLGYKSASIGTLGLCKDNMNNFENPMEVLNYNV